MSDTIKPGEVTTPKIASYAVTESKLATNAVTTDKIRDGAVKTAKIGDKQVTGEKIADRSISNGKIIDGAITGIKIADGTITKDKISDGVLGRPLTPPVATVEIADSSVSEAKLQNNSVTKDKIKDGSITGAKIAQNTITQGDIAANAIGTGEIQNGAVTPAKLSFSVPSRPLVPPIATAEIGDGQVTQAKLDPALSLGDRFVWGAEGQAGNPRSSADVLYLTDISADIPYTVFDLSAWIPANAKGVILQLGMFNQAFTSGRAFFRVRTNSDQRDALGLGNMVGANSQVANQGIVPLVVGTPSIEYALESVGGPWIATFTLYITVVGYIV